MKLKIWFAKFFKSTPESRISRTMRTISLELRFSKAKIKLLICDFAAKPRDFSSNSAVISSPFFEMLEIWSSKEMLSRKLPSPRSAMISIASFEILIFSFLAINSRCAQTSSFEINRKTNRCVLLIIVAGNLWASVVAKMKTACSGGSSRVFRSALKAAFESI